MHVNFDHYQNFTGEQFAADEFFQQWVLSPDREKVRFWNTYLDLHPGQRCPFLAGRKRVKDLAKTGYYKRPLSTAEKQTIKEELFRHFELNALPIPPISPSKVIPLPGRQGLRKALSAAALGLVAVSAWLLYVAPGTVREHPGTMK